MTYKTPSNFDSIKSIKIKKYRNEKTWLENIVEVVFLGQFEYAGYYNRLGAKSRVVAAFFQCAWSCVVLYSLGMALDHMKVVNSGNSNTESLVNLCALIGAIFGATYFREMKDIHNKWEYLSTTFNDVVKIVPSESVSKQYNQREHFAACLAHDILTMNMWAHRSFRSFFKELVEKAIIHENHGEISKTVEALSAIAESGIDYSDINRLISRYLDAQRPDTDKPGVVFLKIVPERPTG